MTFHRIWINLLKDILKNENIELGILNSFRDFNEQKRILKEYIEYYGEEDAYKLAAMMEKSAAKSGKEPLMTTFSVYNLDKNNSFDYSKAQKELGYTTRSYKETIHDEVEWLKQEGLI